MPSKTNTQASSNHWSQLIEDWSDSGLSQQAFCRDRGLSYHKFHYWRKKLSRTPPTKTLPRTSALVPVSYQPKSPVSDLSVHLPNGVSLRGIDSDNLAVVEQLLEALR